MNRSFTLPGFQRFANSLAMTANRKASLAVLSCGLTLHHHAVDLFGKKGKLQPQLAPSTQHQRVRQGFSADETLLRTGSLRSSIEMFHEGLIAGVGSSDPRMVWQELGTPRGIPPRPLLRIAAIESRLPNWAIVRHYASQMVGINMPGGGIGYAALGENIVDPRTGALLASRHIAGGLHGPRRSGASRLVTHFSGPLIRI